eukprot:CAMPEP_0174230998 /NCGR_PEP_ID=MMETSP0417-20130205/1623_1 /TAXON_ID=242541 /ORGANISM="Mayorella sp, Strain BSH-02190019" /LENGTH=197 /DNA_ID=CAMNT_0015308785 /DNA_START=141 /DNA_END=731 /DNA_ORIENTATION=+
MALRRAFSLLTVPTLARSTPVYPVYPVYRPMMAMRPYSSGITIGGVEVEGNLVEELPVPDHVVRLADEVIKLNMIESSQLMNLIQKKLGISDEDLRPQPMAFAAPAGFMPAAAPAAAAPAAAAEETVVEEEAPAAGGGMVHVKLVSFDEGAKWKVLKEIRALKPNQAIAESKKYIAELPSTLTDEAISTEDAQVWVD